MQSQTKEELEDKLVELKSYLLVQPLNMTLKELVRQQETLLKTISPNYFLIIGSVTDSPAKAENIQFRTFFNVVPSCEETSF